MKLLRHRGNRAGFETRREKFPELHPGHPLRGRAYRTPEDARDATKETFLAAFRNLRGFRGDAKVSSWLHRIAVNQCITRQRRAKVRGETALEDEAEKNAAVFAMPLDASPARTAEGKQISVAVR